MQMQSSGLTHPLICFLGSILPLAIGVACNAQGGLKGLQPSPVQASELPLSAIAQPITRVDRLSDVQPTDWAYQALQSLVDRYGCITENPESLFRGNRALSRFEFAAGLNLCLERIQEQLGTATARIAEQTDLAALKKLQSEFSAELQSLSGSVDRLTSRIDVLEKQQFSPTTKLSGQIIMAVNVGGFNGERIVGINGREMANSDPNSTVIQRTALFLNTSFTGNDLLQISLDVGSGGDRDNATAVLEPTLGSGLDYSIKPPSNGTLGLGRLSYTFSPTKNLTISVGPNIRTTDYVDRNSYANRSFLDFSTQALVNNFTLLPVFGTSSGAAIEWKPNSTMTLRGVYAAVAAENPGQQTTPIRGVGLITRSFYSNPTGAGGLFGSTYQGVIEFEYQPSPSVALRVAYSGGELFDNRFSAIGANVEWAVTPTLGLFGRYGRGNYNNTLFGDLTPQSWMAGVSLRDVGKKGTIAGIAIGQPLVESRVGSGTQTNLEAFYNYPINDNLRLSPIFQMVSQAGNQLSNPTIFAGTLRMVFSF